MKYRLGGLAALALACLPVEGGDSTTAGGSSEGGTSGTATGDGPTTTEGACADVIAGDLVLTDDTDVAALACVVEVEGDVLLFDTTSWSDFTPLAQLRVVGGELRALRNTALVSLDGLQALGRVGGSVHIGANPKLADLSALSGVRRLGGLALSGNALTSVAGLQGDVVFAPALPDPAFLYIAGEALTDLDGFAALEGASAPQGLQILLHELPVLTDAGGLKAFAATEGPLRIALWDLPALADASGLDPLAAAGGPIDVELWGLPVLTRFVWPGPLDWLHIRDAAALQELDLPAVTAMRELSLENTGLTSLAGLAALRSVSGLLYLGPCRGGGVGGIVDLHGLEGLEQVWIVHVEGNPALSALTGLSTALRAEQAFIRANPQLPNEAAQAWLDAALMVAPGHYSEACENLGGPECGFGCVPVGE
ncbi:hypothetical protein [Nannocystis sp. SCPEA4]|uniref:hypothetical protein n=1 Tax=Nannocystis sp. SCPEA4 TaxID=2996787 RepID=UPI0022721BAD|nr:hypothetical protein [Nannocystis sp. SCPEA4]MCY1058836.1 hypothetical protein [Nannocystis sp. SCPEA4]